MPEELESQMQRMFKEIYDAADLKYLRPLKREMFKCGHDCLDDKNTIKQAENCIDDCGRPMHQAISLLQKEVTSFQGRIDRCFMDCQDNVRTYKDEGKARHLFEQCAAECVKKFTPHVPEVIKSICNGLDDLKKSK